MMSSNMSEKVNYKLTMPETSNTHNQFYVQANVVSTGKSVVVKSDASLLAQLYFIAYLHAK